MSPQTKTKTKTRSLSSSFFLRAHARAHARDDEDEDDDDARAQKASAFFLGQFFFDEFPLQRYNELFMKEKERLERPIFFHAYE